MTGVTERSTALTPSMLGEHRTLHISSLNLACCAVEAAAGLSAWSQEIDMYASENPATAGDIPLNVLVVAGTVTRANSQLIVDSFEALPEPRVAIAFGVCAISGGPYWDSYAVVPGISDLVQVAVAIPGCPPQPADLTTVLRELSARPASDQRATSERPNE